LRSRRAASDNVRTKTRKRSAGAAGTALFQLRLHFVLEERIGIEKIAAEQLLTSGADRREIKRAIAAKAPSLHVVSLQWRRHLRHRGPAFAQPLVPVGPEHFNDLGEKPARIHVALPRSIP